MTTITIYDTEAMEIEKLAENLDTTAAEIILLLLEAIHDNDINIEDYN